jgi:pSer/pThr/pTyr-binding forkhead associated (FHA) protein
LVENMATTGDARPRSTAASTAAPKHPFLVYPGRGKRPRVFALHPGLRRVTIGRGPSNDITLDWDNEVARVHAELERMGDHWTLRDESGALVNGESIEGRHRLRDGDVVQVGRTRLAFQVPKPPKRRARKSDAGPATPELSATQRRVLEALCRPYKESEFATPATNQQIAEELFLSEDAVKAHLRALVAAFGLDALPTSQKRSQLAVRAMQLGVVA